MNYNRTSRPAARQEWAVGQHVNVGFVKNLFIDGRDHHGWLLVSASGRRYRFEPHLGLFAV